MNIGTDFILNHFDENSVKRLLNEDEINLIIEKTRYPFKGVKKIIDSINERLENIVRENVEDLELYECMIPVYIQYIENKFLASLVDPGTPIGPITSDAIGQQATQVLLNTFHSAGSAKSGGPDGIRENISISENRKTLYSSLHFNNEYFTLKNVLDLKRDFIGIVLGDLMESVLPFSININDFLSNGYEPKSVDEAKDLYDKGFLWWYKPNLHDFSKINTSYKRTGMRIKLDVMKMYVFRITTTEIANILSKYVFVVKTNKNNNGTYDTINVNIVAIPSPTFLGVIDFYSSSEVPDPDDYKNDKYLQLAVDYGEIHTILISGIPGIENFYPMSTPVTSIIRSVEKDKNGKGTWVYFKNIRFSGIPVNKFIHLCKEAGFEVEDSNKTEIENLEYNSHKICLERRSKISVKCLSYYNTHTEMKHKFLKTTKFKSNGRRLHLFYSDDEHQYYHVEKTVVFKTKDVLFEYINEVNNSPELRNAFDYFQFPRNMIEFSIRVAFDGGFGFVIGSYLYTNEYEVDVNVDMINTVKNKTTLETAVNKMFGLMSFSIDKKYRLPKIKTINLEPKKKRRILIKSTACFRDEFDPIDEKTGKKSNLKPVDRFISILNTNVEDETIKTYVYAEAKGSNLNKLCTHHLINTRKTFSNHFRETFGLYGIEGLRNLLAYDLLNMVNSEGYINPKYPLLVADVITSHGLNPMTSEGVSSQGNGVLSTITFDNAKKYIGISSAVGLEESASSVSTSILFCKDFNLGTGYAKMKFDPFTNKRIELVNLTQQDIANFKTIDHEGNEVSFEFSNEIKFSKFPPVKFAMSNFVNKDIFYYIKIGINEIRKKPKKPVSAKLNTLNSMLNFGVSFNKVKISDLIF
jgi:hypothetical protein